MAKSKPGNGKSLVIVESPAKAKTINKYLGPEFIVKASMGHVRDMPKGGLNVDLKNNFAPTYEIIDTRRKIVSDLRSVAKDASEVYLATDLDREGEAIAWHLAHALGLEIKGAKRVIFNEITKSAILNAFKNPRLIDINKVNAQQARRILDRLVGYQVSPLLWKKVARGLSAGRVQSVAVKLVVDRELEIRAFMPEEYWRLTGVFTTDLLRASDLSEQWKSFLAGDDEAEPDDGTDSAEAAAASNAPTLAEKTTWMQENTAFRADLVEFRGKKFDPKDAATAREAAAGVGLGSIQISTIDNDGTNGPRGIPAKGPALKLTKVTGTLDTRNLEFRVRELNTKQSTSRPPGPFSTSTLQQAASNALSFGAQRTMRVAQQLYEGVDLGGETGLVGLITYMRTDSQNISKEALQTVREFIDQSFGPKYLPEGPNFFASKAGAQEAHEAIRPTDVHLLPNDIRRALSEEQFRLYELIWKRFVACQMTPAQWLVTDAMLETKSKNSAAQNAAVFKATGRVLQFDGFMKVAGVFTRFDEQLLPKLVVQQEVAPLDLTPTQHFTAPPSRFSEASLVKALEAEGIGRPSTYASIISTIQERQYVESKGRTLYATDLGIKVTEKLIEGFPDIMDYGFTRKIEGGLDQIEETQRDWHEVIQEFYGPLERDLATAEERMTHARAEMTPSDYKCKECGAPMAYRLSKRGKRFLSCTRYPECKGAMNVDREGKPQELELTEYMCPVCGKPMVKRTGRFGPFFGCSGYPECKTIQQADRKTGLPLPPKPPPIDTGLLCPKCNKKHLLVRVGKRGPFISCGGYPKCRATLAAEKLDEYKKLAEEGKWPPQEVLTKLNISPAAVAMAKEAKELEAQLAAEKVAARAAKKKAAKAPAKAKKKVAAKVEL